MNFSELDIEMVFALMNGKLSAAINRKLYRRFRKMSIDITPEQWTVLFYLWSRNGGNLTESTVRDSTRPRPDDRQDGAQSP